MRNETYTYKSMRVYEWVCETEMETCEYMKIPKNAIPEKRI